MVAQGNNLTENNMSKKHAALALPEEEGAMDMSPMIDMLFLLLIFFVINATAITVKKDKSIQMPNATNATDVASSNGCIVINIYGEPNSGAKRPDSISDDVRWGTDDKQPLANVEELKEHLKTLKERYENNPDYDIRLYLRGDQKALFKGSREVIPAAGEVGVNKIIFAVLPPRPGSE